MIVNHEDLRNRLGATAVALWFALIDKTHWSHTLIAPVATMAGGSKLTDKQVKRGLARLRKAGLVTKAQGRQSIRYVYGRPLGRDLFELPPVAARRLKRLNTWGGRRPGAGRPRLNGSSSEPRPKSKRRAPPKRRKTRNVSDVRANALAYIAEQRERFNREALELETESTTAQPTAETVVPIEDLLDHWTGQAPVAPQVEPRAREFCMYGSSPYEMPQVGERWAKESSGTVSGNQVGPPINTPITKLNKSSSHLLASLVNDCAPAGARANNSCSYKNTRTHSIPRETALVDQSIDDPYTPPVIYPPASATGSTSPGALTAVVTGSTSPAVVTGPAIGSTCEGATAPSSPVARQSVSPAEPTKADLEIFAEANRLLRKLTDFTLPDGKRGEISIVVPRPYKPTGKEPLNFILNHIANLWRALSLKVFGKVDHRMTGVLRAGEKSKLAEPIERWWSACADKDVRPAEWLLWELNGWKKRNPSKPLVIQGVMSARRVLDGRIRYFFRTESAALGGGKIVDPVAKVYMERCERLGRELRLFSTSGQPITAEAVDRIVWGAFPRGVDNARQTLCDIDKRVSQETARLGDLARAGQFIWE